MRWIGFLSWVGVFVVACATPIEPVRNHARDALERGQVQEAVTSLEPLRDLYPDKPEVRRDLGEAYYRAARQALELGREREYTRFLALAQHEMVEAMALAPQDPGPHTWLGILAAYQGDLDRSLTTLQNATRLEPRGAIHYTNLAEVHIYRGEISAARAKLDRARKLGAPPALVELVEVLAAWRTGDYVEARDLFDAVHALDPEIVASWNEAPVNDPIETFQDLTRFCCGHVACGPYMEGACDDMQWQVRHREVSRETLAEEMRLEQERRRRMREIYEKRRELSIVVEEAEEPS